MEKENFNKVLIFSFILVWIPVLVICYLTPMHSDDFYYMSIGSNIRSQLEHYLGWSGRLVANLISGFTLSIDNRLMRALINSIATPLLVVNIALLQFVFLKKNNLRLFVSIILIFLCYWISNPNLGQVAFWVVGTSNYGWTSVFVVYFFRKYTELCIENSTPISRRDSLLMIIVGFMAGCSNENVGISLLLSLIILFSLNAYSNRCFNWMGISYLLPCFLGVTTLLSSPGNYIRNAAEGAGWASKSFFQKVWEHFFFRVPESMSHIWLIFIFFVFVLSLLNKKAHDKYIFVSFSLLSLFVFEVLVMVGAPSFPARAVNAPFTALLCVFSLSLSRLDGGNKNVFYVASLILSFFYFIPNYFNTFVAYKSLYAQSEARNNILLSDKVNGIKNSSIPNYFFKELISSNYFDLFHSNKSMSVFFSVENISTFDAGFDYSETDESCGKKIHDEDEVCLTSYMDNLFSSRTLVLEITGLMFNKIKSGAVIYMEIRNKKSEVMNVAFDNAPVLIGHKIYLYKKMNFFDTQQIAEMSAFVRENEGVRKLIISN